MTTDKKNQHYIPKFYLRNFSFELNQKQIGIFNTRTGFFFQKAPLKSQGSKDFFYGKDGIIEDKLSEIEGSLAYCIKQIIGSRNTPARNSHDHVTLLAFAALTDLRNPVKLGGMSEKIEIMKDLLVKLHPEADLTKLVPTSSHEFNVELSLSHVTFVSNLCSDLHYKLLINDTETPFICSDFPIVRYNQYLEALKWKHGKTGFGSTGLQIIIPISPSVSVFFYDSLVYKVGDKRKNHLLITLKKDVDQLNLLQILNCNETIFFNGKISHHYLQTLIEKSKKFKKANQSFGTIHDAIVDNNEDGKIMQFGATDCEIKLELTGLKRSSRALGVNWSPSVAQLRPHALRINRDRDRFA